MSTPRRPFSRRTGAGPALAALAVLGATLCGPSGPVRAQQPAAGGSFTAAQRSEIVAIVRNALMTDPSILGDAIVALRASAQRKEEVDLGTAIRANRAALSGQPGDAVLGDPGGDVTLVEFYDPRCPYCRKVLPDIEALLGSDRRLRVVEKLIPILGPNSVIDAQAIQAASLQGKYAVLQRALMTDGGAAGPDRVRTVAAAAGLDVARLQRDMHAPEVTSVLQRNMALAQSLHLTGTPSFIIGEQVIPGATGLDDLRQAVKAARLASR